MDTLSVSENIEKHNDNDKIYSLVDDVSIHHFANLRPARVSLSESFEAKQIALPLPPRAILPNSKTPMIQNFQKRQGHREKS